MERTKKKIDMDYEKKYKEALEWMRGVYPTLTGAAQEDAEHFFPELRESEDERIRKQCIKLLREAYSTKYEALECIAYLEKQKEQKPAEWSEDKFPKDIEKDATQFCFDKGFNITSYQAKEIATHYLRIGHNFGYVEGRKNAHIPAKELGLPSSMDFKQEWSDEDEKMRRNLMSLLANMRGDRITEETYQKYYPWLKSLRSRPKPSDNWKPSEEQPQVADASKMEPEGIDAVVSHREGVYYIAANTEQLNARLKQFDEGAKVLVYIEARKEE